MTAAQATFTITVPWWAYGACCAGVLGLIAGGYVAGRLDGRDNREANAMERRLAPTVNRWRAVDQNTSGRHAAIDDHGHADVEGAPAWPVNRARPGWADALEVWGQPRRPAGYPRPPALTAQPDPRAAEPTSGRAPVTAVNPLEWWEEIAAMNVALGGPVRWAANAEETGWIPAVRG